MAQPVNSDDSLNKVLQEISTSLKEIKDHLANVTPGISMRDVLAAMAMQGVLSRRLWVVGDETRCIQAADAMAKALNDSEQT